MASTTDRLRNSLKSQKPGSLTCEAKMLPQDTASTISSGAATSGSTTPAAVTTATVAEPSATRISAAIPQASTMGERFQPSVSSVM